MICFPLDRFLDAYISFIHMFKTLPQERVDGGDLLALSRSANLKYGIRRETEI